MYYKPKKKKSQSINKFFYHLRIRNIIRFKNKFIYENKKIEFMQYFLILYKYTQFGERLIKSLQRSQTQERKLHY